MRSYTDYGSYVSFTLHGGTSNVGLTLGAAKTIHVGSGELDVESDYNFGFDNEPLPHTLSLTGTGAAVTQTLPQTDSFDCPSSDGDTTADIHAGPTVTFDMGTQGRIDVTPQE